MIHACACSLRLEQLQSHHHPSFTIGSVLNDLIDLHIQSKTNHSFHTFATSGIFGYANASLMRRVKGGSIYLNLSYPRVSQVD